jgi:phage terminase large subunit-like protein
LIDVMAGGERKRLWAFQTSAPNSIEMQQPLVWEYLPPEWKGLKKGRVTNISYTQKMGFAENSFVAPNASQVWFRNYMQDISTIEGGEVDFIWADELVPENWLATMRFRLATRNGVLLVTFTPIEGYNATVKKYLAAARTLEWVEADLLGGEKVPRVQEVEGEFIGGRARIFYFHTSDNPFGGYENLARTLAKAGREQILCRAYGVPTRAIANRFPKFSEEVHVVDQEFIPAEGTRYLIVDPCGGRNWFMTWVLVDVRGRMFIYREWPCPKTYIDGVGFPGPWAEPDGKKADGRPGSAQQPFGFGIRRYIEEIKKLEGEEKIFERLMDSRYGNSRTVGKDRPVTLIEECEEEGMEFVPTPGEDIDEGVDLVNSMLDWNRNRPMEAGNEPRLYVERKCENTIYALREWTGRDGRHGACKDPVDNVRYAVLGGLEDVSGEVLMVRGGGAY